MNVNYFTSESVTEGHPDKVCDQISDAILDELIAGDPYARVACETTATTGLVTVIGEITTKCYVDIPKIVRRTLLDIGYNNSVDGFDGNTCAVVTSINEQSADIAMGVDKAIEIRHASDRDDEYDQIGAGDQGMMFGYACDETPELMPLPISIAHRMAKRLAEVRKDQTLPYLRPDGKTQVSVEYHDHVPVRLEAVVISTQHSEDVSLETIRRDMIKHVIEPVVPAGFLDENTKIHVNPTGRFVIGGPLGDSGLTGRKIIVDTYGGYARHGGGAFSGKDPTKVDRSASYAARYVAKNIVAAGLAKRCEVQIAYAIGVAKPMSVNIETFDTECVPVDVINELISKHFDLRPAAIIDKLELRKPIYRALAAYGHIGREDLGVSWEKTDLADKLRADAGL